MIWDYNILALVGSCKLCGAPIYDVAAIYHVNNSHGSNESYYLGNPISTCDCLVLKQLRPNPEKYWHHIEPTKAFKKSE